jgi:hypothetical protein
MPLTMLFMMTQLSLIHRHTLADNQPAKDDRR